MIVHLVDGTYELYRHFYGLRRGTGGEDSQYGATRGVLNTVLYFPSGAVYPQQGFPAWMQVIAAADPFTYAVHAFKSLLLKNTGFEAIAFDLGFLVIFSVVTMGAATLLFRRTL